MRVAKTIIIDWPHADEGAGIGLTRHVKENGKLRPEKQFDGAIRLGPVGHSHSE